MKQTVINTAKRARSNSPNLLVAASVVGVVSTAYLSARAGYRSAYEVQEAEIATGHDLDTREKAEVVWRLYIPAAVVGVATIGSTIASVRIGNRRTTAMAAAYSLSERTFAQYRDKVVEHVGENKERAVRDEVAQEKLDANPTSIIIEGDQVLACELHTRRYFLADMQKLKSAQNQVNELVMNQMHCTLDEFYDILGLEHTAQSDCFGWDSDKLMELRMTTALATDGRPCLAFEYNYLKAL